jgi:hypothetical protein
MRGPARHLHLESVIIPESVQFVNMYPRENFVLVDARGRDQLYLFHCIRQILH